MALFTIRYIIFYVAVLMICEYVVLSMFFGCNQRSIGNTSHNYIVPMVQKHDVDLEYSFHKILVSATTKYYSVNEKPKCWINQCMAPPQLNFVGDRKYDASQWYKLGVTIMARFVSSPPSPHLTNDHLNQALDAFDHATTISDQFGEAWMNKGVIKIYMDDYHGALLDLGKACANLSKGTSQEASCLMFLGIANGSSGSVDNSLSQQYFSQACKLDPSLGRKHYGILKCVGTCNVVNHELTQRALVQLSVYVHFAPLSIGLWGLQPHNAPDVFAKQSYSVFRDVIPPFVVQIATDYYNAVIKGGHIKLGDVQSLRYAMGDDCISRFMHMHLTDFVRRAVAHNTEPSYTYFGGYSAGAKLDPHLDRRECVFTLSVNFENYPLDLVWQLGLNKKPFGEYVITPNEEDRVIVDLRPGDGLLFMGRQLVHYRLQELKDDSRVNQVFFHWVEEGGTPS